MSGTKCRFSMEDEMTLLEEVLALNPLKRPPEWKTVQFHLSDQRGKTFTLRSLRDHVKHLIELYRRGAVQQRRIKATAEQRKEVQRLLGDVSVLYNAHHVHQRNGSRNARKKSRTSAAELRAVSVDLKERVAQSSHGSCESTPLGDRRSIDDQLFPRQIGASRFHVNPSSGTRMYTNVSGNCRGLAATKYNTTFANYLGNKDADEEIELRKKELELETRKLDLEECRLAFEWKKFEVEKQERLCRVQTDEMQRQLFLRLVEGSRIGRQNQL